MYTGISLQYIQFFEVVNAIKTFRSQWMHFLKREHFKCWTRQIYMYKYYNERTVGLCEGPG